MCKSSPCSEYIKYCGDGDKTRCLDEQSSNLPDIQNAMQIQRLRLITHTQTQTATFPQYQTKDICVNENGKKNLVIDFHA